MERFQQLVESTDHTLIFPSITHILTLWYPDENGIKWHVDDYGRNNRDTRAPVFSLTLGNTCTFEYKLVDAEQIISVDLNSGDLIVFGGPQRLMPHSVKKIHMGTFDKLQG